MANPTSTTTPPTNSGGAGETPPKQEGTWLGRKISSVLTSIKTTVGRVAKQFGHFSESLGKMANTGGGGLGIEAYPPQGTGTSKELQKLQGQCTEFHEKNSKKYIELTKLNRVYISVYKHTDYIIGTNFLEEIKKTLDDCITDRSGVEKHEDLRLKLQSEEQIETKLTDTIETLRQKIASAKTTMLIVNEFEMLFHVGVGFYKLEAAGPAKDQKPIALSIDCRLAVLMYEPDFIPNYDKEKFATETLELLDTEEEKQKFSPEEQAAIREALTPPLENEKIKKALIAIGYKEG